MYSLALKNIMFYKGRSLTTFILSMLSTLFFIVYVAFMDGSHESMLRNSLNIYTGAIQVMHEGNHENPSYDTLLENEADVLSSLSTIKGIKAYAPRLESFALLSSKEDSVGAMVTGILPQSEMKISKLKEALTEGRYLNDKDTNALYIGAELAKRFGVKVGDEIALVGSAIDYSFAADTFRIVGVFKTGLFEFDASSAFVNKSYFDTLMLSQNIASYVVIAVDDLEKVDQIVHKIKQNVAPNIEVDSWKILMASMVQAMEVDSLFGYISMGLFFVVIFFVIMIFGFINISGRIRELGLLGALGLKATDILYLMLYETAILALSSVIVGMVIGAYMAYYFEIHPIVIEGIAETYKQYGIVTDAVPTRFDLFTIVWNTVVVLVLNFLALFYPIYYLRQFTPTEAMHHV
ncbi:FtsX-like permease family protein [Sulfurovum sp. zt1-1]|uniref:FtsX-like permease family protein n=1 Tax=Sulfurovum zhangzhouensis TaxID=3019067 RepID=A0ABT7QVV5_9BACT|nr:ABC transporter permease [Sulfurovum zhangzhouensis]MDM5270977.1 FtsX-like permease family protein [Sulfurovum zhangzhouensis]